MSIMLATYSTNKIIVLQRYVSERKKIRNKHSPDKHAHTNKQINLLRTGRTVSSFYRIATLKLCTFKVPTPGHNSSCRL